VQRGVALGVPGLAVATAAGLYAQVRKVVNAPLPRFPDLDPSGWYGDPDGSPLRVAVLGDSSVTGPGLVDAAHVWIAQLADRLPHAVELRSLARGGSRVRDVLLRQAPLALLDRPDLYVVAVGANDALHATPTGRFARDLEALLELLRAAAPVVTLGIGDLSIIPRLTPTLRPLAARRSSTIDRLHATVAARLDRVVRVPVAELSDDHFRQVGRSLFVGDLFHPNRLGHGLWAELFDPYVRRALGLPEEPGGSAPSGAPVAGSAA
jgi:lysophospholipase L1-like esterase